MGTTRNRIGQVLKEAEAKLLRLIAESARAGDLVAVEEARKAALQLRGMIGASNVTTYGKSDNLRASASSAPKSKSRKKTKQENDAYPQFDVRNGTLYRIGWSKKKNDRYEHKVPQAIALSIVEIMTTLSLAHSGPLTAEQIISRINADVAVPIPNYQVYVVIGFLRSRGLIEQIGRDGYEIPNGFEKSATALWKSLV